MSLNWTVDQIDNFEERCFITATKDEPMSGIVKGARVVHPLTHTLVFMSMSVGLGCITTKSWRTWYARARAVELLGGPFRGVGDSATYITAEDVYSHIGLTTNVSRETDAQWRKRMVGGWCGEFEQNAERWLEEQKTEAA